MRSLIIDTSTERGCAAFFEDQKKHFACELPSGLNNSKYLLPEIHRALKSLNWSLQDLDFIAVGVGPGSYTGIRVGVMVAKSMAFALKKPLVSFCSLEGFLPSQDGPFAAIIDARIGGAYLLKGVASKGGGKFEGKAQIVELHQLEHLLKDVKYLVTPQASLIKKKLNELYPEREWIWEEKDPNLFYLNDLATSKYVKGEFGDGRHVELLYLRKTQAELEKEKQKT